MDNSTINLHYKSLKLTPPLLFNSSITKALDNTFASLDGQLGTTLLKIRDDISKIQETSTTTLNDILTYIAFTLAILNIILIVLILVAARHVLRTIRLNKSEEKHLPHDTQVVLTRCQDCNHLIKRNSIPEHEDSVTDELTS